MRITAIELAGPNPQGSQLPDVYARISRKPGSLMIDVRIMRPTGEEDHHVLADNDGAVRWMARHLQVSLDGCRGTNSDIDGYYRALQWFAD